MPAVRAEEPAAADAAVPRGLAPRPRSRNARRRADDATRTPDEAPDEPRRSSARPVDPAPAGRPGPASASGRAADGRQGVHEPRRGATYRPSMFLTLTLPSYGPVTAGRDAPDRCATTTAGPRWTRCTSRSWSTGSGRTCVVRRATRCSTSRSSRSSAGWLRICMPRSAARSRGPSCGRWRPRRTTRSGGRRTSEVVYERRRCRSGDGGVGYVDPTTRGAAADVGRGARRARRRRGRPAGARGAVRAPGRPAGDPRHRGRRRPPGGLPDEVPDQVDLRTPAATRTSSRRRSCGTCDGSRRRSGSCPARRGAGTGCGTASSRWTRTRG